MFLRVLSAQSTGSVRLNAFSLSSLRLTQNPFLAFYYTFKFVLVLWMALPQTGYVFYNFSSQEDAHS